MRDNLQRALRAATEDGRQTGHRLGYIAGWRWGVVCGAAAGMLAGGALVVGALRLGVWVAT